HGGDTCHAKAGPHREHAIFGNDRCASAHPSDVAAALLALDATIRTTQRDLPIADLYRLPTDDDRDVTGLKPDELVLELEGPPAMTTSRRLLARADVSRAGQSPSRRRSWPSPHLWRQAAARSRRPRNGLLQRIVVLSRASR